MVKQGSFFQRLKDRWGSGSGVRIDGPAGDAAAAPDGKGHDAPAAPINRVASLSRPARVEPERAPARELVSEAVPIETRSSRKVSDREEAMLALGGHFQELTALLRGSQARTDDQLGKLVSATSALPAIGQQQLDMLRALSTQLERQNVLGEQVAATMTRLPNLLQNVEQALARAAATDERTAATVREFQTTMDRIHGAMGQMVQHSEQQAKATQALAGNRDEQMRGLATGLEQAQQRAAAEVVGAKEEGG
jgi:predicted  nucleic acid-binding Zn-ribbon protein